MSSGSDLQFDYVPLTGRSRLRWEGVLGGAIFDGDPALAEGVAEDIPLTRVRMPVLDTTAVAPDAVTAVCEIWRTNRPASSGQRGSIRYRHDGSLLFGCLALSETGAPPDDTDPRPGRIRPPTRGTAVSEASPLHRITEQAYREIHSTLRALEYPHLVRVWNYLPQINVETHGLERYRQFNSARRDALLASGQEIAGNVPAACALGSESGSPLVVYFLASRHAPHVIENPRQISAYEYPPQYGTSPAFSRACILGQPSGATLFISGTASIVGHRSSHPGDVAAQTRETLANIEALLAQANRKALARFDLATLAYKVYVRKAADLPQVRSHLCTALGKQARLVYLRADVCRQDLLVEIEAVGNGRQ